MKKYLFSLCVIVLFLAFAFPALAQFNAFNDVDRTTDDPNHRGYISHHGYNLRAEWKDTVVTCPACREMARSYDGVMRSLFSLRYRIQEINTKIEKSRKTDEDLLSYMTQEEAAKGLSEKVENMFSRVLNYRESAHEMQTHLPALQAQERELSSAASALRQQLQNCEQNMCQQAEGTAVAAGNGASASSTFPFAWTGPYPEVCHKCARLAQRLNELPNIYRNTQAQLEKAKADKILAESAITQIRAEDTNTSAELGTGTERTSDFARFEKARHKRAIEDLKKAEQERDEAQERITTNQHDVDAITRNFDETLRLYNACTPTCRTQTGACPRPAATAPISVGKASEVGSSGKKSSELKNKAMGMAMGGMMGGGNGGGFGFGGSGMHSQIEAMVPGAMSSGTAKEQPKTDKDPVKKKVAATAPGGTKLELGAIIKDGNLIVSSAIKDSPGKGTFQAVYIENAQGQRMEPDAYYIYELWLNWTLNVWWTHDRYVNGEHVLHEQGEWMDQGKEKVGTFSFYQKGKEKENAIWNRLGFSHATEGIKGLGASFPVDLKKTGPVSVVVHTTLPKQDPVITDPFIYTLSDDGKGGVKVENAVATVACP